MGGRVIVRGSISDLSGDNEDITQTGIVVLTANGEVDSSFNKTGEADAARTVEDDDGTFSSNIASDAVFELPGGSLLYLQGVHHDSFPDDQADIASDNVVGFAFKPDGSSDTSVTFDRTNLISVDGTASGHYRTAKCSCRMDRSNCARILNIEMKTLSV